MPKITVIFSILFILLGVAAYVITGMESWTALIPAIFGAVLLIFGLLGFKEGLRKHVMHAAAAWSLLGLLGTWRGFFTALSMLGGAEVERAPAVIVQGIMAVGCVVFLVLCVRSFIQARRARAAA